MNRDHAYAAATDNQIRALDHVGMFGKPPAKPVTALPSLVDPYGTKGSLELRARTWLEVNCAMCHRPKGIAAGELDMRWRTPLEKMNLLGKAPKQKLVHAPDALLVYPGHPHASELLRRISSRGPRKMPPVGSYSIDPAGHEVLRKWIDGLPRKRADAK